MRVGAPTRRVTPAHPFSQVDAPDPAALLFRYPRFAPCSRSHPQPSDPFERDALQVDAHGLRMAIQLSGDLVGRFACPTLDHHLGVKFPISRRVMAPSQLAHQAFLLLILCRSR